MKRLLLTLLISAVLHPGGLIAQEVSMKSGSRFLLKNPRRQGDMLFLSVVAPGGNGSAEVGYKVGDVERVEMPPPAAVNAARSLLFAGKLAEAVKAIKPAYDELSPLRGIPGSNWDEAGLVYAAALQAGGRNAEAIAVLEQFPTNTPKGSAANAIARVRLAVLKSPNEAAVKVADEAIAAKLGNAATAEANTAAGDALLAGRNFDEALTRYLRVVIFCPGDRWLGARSLLGAAKAMGSLDEKKNCVRTLREISTSYPGTPQADAAAKILAAGGEGYAAIAAEIDGDEAEARKLLIEASGQQKPN
jgi:tetratricopeptide (TPR) repeat protein